MIKPRFHIDREEQVGLQIAPMVNLMFVLLAAFTIAAGEQMLENELGVQVPNPGQGSSLIEDPVHILIFKDGSVRLNATAIGKATDRELEGLKQRLKRLVELDSNQYVIIRPEGDAKHQRVIDVLNACTYAGVKKLSFGG